MLLPRVRVDFIFKQRKVIDQFLASIFWFNDIINKSSLCSQIRIGKFFSELINFFIRSSLSGYFPQIRRARTAEAILM